MERGVYLGQEHSPQWLDSIAKEPIVEHGIPRYPMVSEVKAQTHRTQLENRVSARRRLAELPLGSFGALGQRKCRTSPHHSGISRRSWAWKRRQAVRLAGAIATLQWPSGSNVQADRKAKRIRSNKARRARRRRKKAEADECR